MNRGAWRGLGLAALAWCAAAVAEDLRVEALRVPHAEPWRRGPADQEKRDGVFLLDGRAGDGSPLQVAIFRRAPALKTGAEIYYRNLARHWRAQYGGLAAIQWLEAGGVKWLACRRPGRDEATGVFHLSTVFDGRAYSLLAFAPAETAAPPAALLDLLAAMRLGTGSGAASPPTRWLGARTYRFRPSGEALEAVVAADRESLGEDGMLTGYGLDYGGGPEGAGVDWFLDGFRWKTVAGRVTRVPWANRGHLEVEPPGEWTDASLWTLRLTLAEGEEGVSARLLAWDLCAPRERLTSVLEGLDRGARVPMERLAAERPEGCPPPTAGASRSLHGEAGRTVAGSLALPAGTPSSAGPETGLARVRLVEVRLEPRPGRTAPGDGLLGRARLFFAFEPR